MSISFSSTVEQKFPFGESEAMQWVYQDEARVPCFKPLDFSLQTPYLKIWKCLFAHSLSR